MASNNLLTVIYHDIFDYALDKSEISKWKTKFQISSKYLVASSQGYYYLKEKKSLVTKRLKRKEISQERRKELGRYKKIFKWVPSVRMVGITGSLAMNNSSEKSDIDLMVITSKGCLWITRLIIYMLFYIYRVPVRRFGEKQECGKLCMNIWLDESDLEIGNRNIYTAHEVAQVDPIVNKNKSYERFINSNKWVVKYWPKAVKIQNSKSKTQKASLKILIMRMVEPLARWLQLQKINKEKTREKITKQRAFFHPVDWSEKIKKELSKRGVGLDKLF